MGLQLLVVVAAAVFGWNQLKEAKDLREDQTRPFVVIDLESSRRPFFDLAVRNIGATMARDVTFEFQPELQSTIDHFKWDKLKMFRDGIATLPPGKEIRTFFDSGIQRYESKLPDLYEATVSYRGPTKDRRYTETIALDFGIYWDRLSMTIYDVHDLYGELKKLREEVHKWTSPVGRGLKTMSPEDIERYTEAVLAQQEERRSGEQGEGSEPDADK